MILFTVQRLALKSDFILINTPDKKEEKVEKE